MTIRMAIGAAERAKLAACRALASLKERTRPRTNEFMLGVAADLLRPKAQLLAENALLRQQLIVLKRSVKRPKLRVRDRIILVALSRVNSAWKDALHVIQPDTLLKRHTGQFDRVAKGTDIEVLHIPPKTPLCNALCERFLGSVRRECLDHILILSEDHLRRVIVEYVRYFNESRPHQGVGQRVPGPTESPGDGVSGEVVAIPILGGLHHEYHRAA